MHAPITYAILPSVDARPEQVVRSLMSLRRCTLPTVYVHSPGDEPPVGPDVKPVLSDCDSLGGMLETARRRAIADMYLWVPPGVQLKPDAAEVFAKAFNAHPEAGLFVSDYTVAGREVSLCPLRGDLTEREDLGAVWGLPAWALQRVGGADPALRYTTFYDLRLKLMEIAPLAHIPIPTHEVEPDTGAQKGEALFYPGRGAYGGFSYLFMTEEEERETEEVFYHALRRRGAFLEVPGETVQPAEIAPGSPVVSVIIPVRNRAKFLPFALESVLRGTLQDFEIIVVDNASTDSTKAVAEGYSERDPRIRVLANDVNLIAKALNLGIREAKGRYIAQLDSDDEYTPTTLQTMVEHLDAHPQCGLAISYYELIDEKGDVLEEFGVIKHLEYNVNNILRVDGAGAVRVWHKSVIERFGGFNERDFPNYGEDYDLVLKVSEHYRVDRVHDVLYRYRRHPGNTDALRRQEDKIRAKTLARTRAVERRRALNQKRKIWPPKPQP